MAKEQHLFTTNQLHPNHSSPRQSLSWHATSKHRAFPYPAEPQSCYLKPHPPPCPPAHASCSFTEPKALRLQCFLGQVYRLGLSAYPITSNSWMIMMVQLQANISDIVKFLFTDCYRYIMGQNMTESMYRAKCYTCRIYTTCIPT